MQHHSKTLRALSLGIALLAVAISASVSDAADLQWGGLYRFEAIRLNNPELSGKNTEKAYILHHLVLAPKIVAADGITIFGRFDVMNNLGFGTNNQAGEFIGKGPGPGTIQAADGTNSNVLARNQGSGTLAVTELYASWAQEFGQLIVGRAPLHFGLGSYFNAGEGSFDHYLSTLDMISYKVVMGNLFVMPIIGKVHEGAIQKGDDVNDYILHVQYDNPETDLSLGAIYQMRIGNGNDMPVNSSYMGGRDYTGGTGGSTNANNYKHSYIGLFSSQKIGTFTAGVEAGMLSGETGVKTGTVYGAQKDVKLNGFGLATEFGWKPEGSKWTMALKAGFATGDDPGSTDSQEGYVFSRNYRVGMLMFTHPLGQRDLLRTGLYRDTTSSASSQIDTEAISNAVYIAPSFQFHSNDRVSYGATFITGRLNKQPLDKADPANKVNNVGAEADSNLGYEVDLNFTYSPFDRFTWITELGLLMPGEAWKAGALGLDNSFAYGVTTKAAIRF